MKAKEKDLIKRYLTPEAVLAIMRKRDTYLRAKEKDILYTLDTLCEGKMIYEYGCAPSEATRSELKRLDQVFREDCMDAGFKAGVDCALNFLGYDAVFQNKREVKPW